MANGMDANRIQSLVIFNEIIPEYCVGDDIECRFYVDPSLDSSADKIGLFRLGWSHKQDFIAIKEVRECVTDEFDEKTIVFNGNEMTDDNIRTDVEYQFCYFHPFGDQKSYQLCGRSNTFRFYKSVISTPESERRGASPSAPDLSIHYPTLERENFNFSPDPLQTRPKSLFSPTLEDVMNQSTPKTSRNSSRVRFDLPDDLSFEENNSKYQELDDLRSQLRSAERRIASLESELETRMQNESKFEDLHNELMDTIRLSEVKVASLEEHLRVKDRDYRLLEEQCLSQELIIAELREKLNISRAELESYEERSIESIEKEEQRIRELNRENRLLKDKLQEVMEMSERLKQSNDRFIREKKSYQSINELLDLYRRRSETSISCLSNEMTDDMQEFCVDKAKQALEQLNDIKSIADFIVFAMDMEYGDCWNCFIAQDLAHNSLLHVFGTYILFAINGIKFIVYKTNEVCDRDSSPSPIPSNSDNWPEIKIISKSRSVDNAFERLICKEVMAAIEQDFSQYTRLSSHLCRVLQTIYGLNCWIICGESDRFDGNPVTPKFNQNYFYIELEINFMKIVIIQITE